MDHKVFAIHLKANNARIHLRHIKGKIHWHSKQTVVFTALYTQAAIFLLLHSLLTEMDFM